MTFACFIESGKMPTERKWLINELKGVQSTCEIFLIMVGGITSWPPGEKEFFRESNIRNISFGIVGSRKILLGLIEGGGKTAVVDKDGKEGK